ncbi:MAG: PDZ domain-containing protein [Betaproteobacteria bacterium]
MSLGRSCILTLALLAAVASTSAQIGGPPPPDPRVILQQAKDASGGKAWDALRSQHSAVTMQTAGLTGAAERWSDITSGQSRLTYSIGPVKGVVGFDGKVAWTQDETGASHAETVGVARELAINAAYRDRLAFWYPDRGAALISYKERANVDGADFDVIRITPEGGRPFELWINVETRLIERLVEREAQAMRTEIYMDLREVQGVKVPYRVRATREDPRQDELVVVEAMQFNRPLTGISFAQPAPPKPDFAFPAGRASVTVPIDIQDGHLFVQVRIDGKGPFRMLLDSGNINVLLPDVATALKLGPEATAAAAGQLNVVRAARIDIGGVVIAKPVFATLDLKDVMRRVEGVDNVAGIIGVEIFKRMPVTIDYARAQLVLHDPARFKYAGNDPALPLTFRGTMPQIKARVDGIDGNFDVGTGARGSLTLAAPFVAAHDLAAKYGATQVVTVGAGLNGPVRGTLARAGKFEFGGTAFANPVTVLALSVAGADPDQASAGSIGYDVLRRFKPTFDFAHGVVYLEPAPAMAEVDDFERAGMWLEQGPLGFIVVDVVTGGPADLAGITRWDVITAINGKPAGTMTLAAARASQRAAAGTKLRLQVRVSGERTLILRNLI